MNLNIDLSGLKVPISAKGLDLLAVAIVNNLTAQALRNVYNNANVLNSTRAQYMNSVSMQPITRYHQRITLFGMLPNMLESGASAFDMKVGLLRSPKAKRGKDGRLFITVPFRHGATGTINNPMPIKVYQEAKKLKANVTAFGFNLKKGQSLSNVPSPYNAKKTRAKIQSETLTDEQKAEYTHTTSIYTGMIRNEKLYEKATQSSYVTFRRVSEPLFEASKRIKGSAPNSWIHKGIKAYNIMGKAGQEIETQSSQIVGNLIDSFTGK